MKETFINDVVQGMIPFLDNAQLEELQYVLRQNLMGKSVVQEEPLDPIESGFPSCLSRQKEWRVAPRSR